MKRKDEGNTFFAVMKRPRIQQAVHGPFPHHHCFNFSYDENLVATEFKDWCLGKLTNDSDGIVNTLRHQFKDNMNYYHVIYIVTHPLFNPDLLKQLDKVQDIDLLLFLAESQASRVQLIEEWLDNAPALEKADFFYEVLSQKNYALAIVYLKRMADFSFHLFNVKPYILPSVIQLLADEAYADYHVDICRDIFILNYWYFASIGRRLEPGPNLTPILNHHQSTYFETLHSAEFFSIAMKLGDTTLIEYLLETWFSKQSFNLINLEAIEVIGDYYQAVLNSELPYSYKALFFYEAALNTGRDPRLGQVLTLSSLDADEQAFLIETLFDNPGFKPETHYEDFLKAAFNLGNAALFCKVLMDERIKPGLMSYLDEEPKLLAQLINTPLFPDQALECLSTPILRIVIKTLWQRTDLDLAGLAFNDQINVYAHILQSEMFQKDLFIRKAFWNTLIMMPDNESYLASLLQIPAFVMTLDEYFISKLNQLPSLGLFFDAEALEKYRPNRALVKALYLKRETESQLFLPPLPGFSDFSSAEQLELATTLLAHEKFSLFNSGGNFFESAVLQNNEQLFALLLADAKTRTFLAHDCSAILKLIKDNRKALFSCFIEAQKTRYFRLPWPTLVEGLLQIPDGLDYLKALIELPELSKHIVSRKLIPLYSASERDDLAAILPVLIKQPRHDLHLVCAQLIALLPGVDGIIAQMKLPAFQQNANSYFRAAADLGRIDILEQLYQHARPTSKIYKFKPKTITEMVHSWCYKNQIKTLTFVANQRPFKEQFEDPEFLKGKLSHCRTPEIQSFMMNKLLKADKKFKLTDNRYCKIMPEQFIKDGGKPNIKNILSAIETNNHALLSLLLKNYKFSAMKQKVKALEASVFSEPAIWSLVLFETRLSQSDAVNILLGEFRKALVDFHYMHDRPQRLCNAIKVLQQTFTSDPLVNYSPYICNFGSMAIRANELQLLAHLITLMPLSEKDCYDAWVFTSIETGNFSALQQLLVLDRDLFSHLPDADQMFRDLFHLMIVKKPSLDICQAVIYRVLQKPTLQNIHRDRFEWILMASIPHHGLFVELLNYFRESSAGQPLSLSANFFLTLNREAEERTFNYFTEQKAWLKLDLQDAGLKQLLSYRYLQETMSDHLKNIDRLLKLEADYYPQEAETFWLRSIKNARWKNDLVNHFFYLFPDYLMSSDGIKDFVLLLKHLTFLQDHVAERLISAFHFVDDKEMAIRLEFFRQYNLSAKHYFTLFAKALINHKFDFCESLVYGGKIDSHHPECKNTLFSIILYCENIFSPVLQSPVFQKLLTLSRFNIQFVQNKLINLSQPLTTSQSNTLLSLFKQEPLHQELIPLIAANHRARMLEWHACNSLSIDDNPEVRLEWHNSAGIKSSRLKCENLINWCSSNFLLFATRTTVPRNVEGAALQHILEILGDKPLLIADITFHIFEKYLALFQEMLEDQLALPSVNAIP